MNDNETNIPETFEDENEETVNVPYDEPEETVYESTDIYSEHDTTGEAKKEPFSGEKSYDGFFEAQQESAYSDYNPYSGTSQQSDAQSDGTDADSVNPYVNASFEAQSVKGEPVNTRERNTASAEQFNPYAAPRNPQYFSGNYQQTPPFNQNGHMPYNQQGYYSGNNMHPEKKNGGKKVAVGIVASCIVIAVIAIVVGLFGGTKPDTNSSTNGERTTEALTSIKNIMSTTQNSVELSQVNSVVIAEKVRPSVVGVMTYKDGQLYGEGSGVLWAEKGEYTYVVTCAHVIKDSGVTYGVLLLDGKTYEAEMVAYDTRTDIGVIKVKATGLPLAEIGDSSALRIGEPIYAIGNPGGSEYFGSITDGIVSAIDRSVSATYTMTCIQHNAAINPGNSGGALVNTAGQIVGINSSKIASTEYEGMGFAVPTTIAVHVVDALIQYGYVPNRPKLGIEYAEVSAYQLYSLVVSIKGLPRGSLVIAGISADSSLKNTEAQVGDLIIGVNGKDMDDPSVLLDLIDTGAVGDTLTLTLCRVESRTYKTKTFDVTITLIEDKGDLEKEEETTTEAYHGNDYYYGGAESFEDFFDDYFGFGW